MSAATDPDATLLPAEITLLSGAIAAKDPRASVLAEIYQIAAAGMQGTVFSASI